ncbi:MAG: hypothetical protein HYW48_03925 [Deltaproteobacteria bacterium]|nr:hypothetical protein [Deltaproteobacteria bacterium]
MNRRNILFCLLFSTLQGSRPALSKDADQEGLKKELAFKDLMPMIETILSLEHRFTEQRKELEKRASPQTVPSLKEHWGEIEQAFRESKQSLKDALKLRALIDSQALQEDRGPSLEAEIENLKQEVHGSRSYSSLFAKEKIDLRDWFSQLYDALAFYEVVNDSQSREDRFSRSALTRLKNEVRDLAREGLIILEP